MNPELSQKQQQAVGIQQFISKGTPILAVTKYLLTDFIVNEIDEQNNVVSVKSKPNPHDPLLRKQEQPQRTKYQISEQIFEEVVKVFGKDCAESIRDLYDKIQSGDKISEWDYTVENMPEMNKEQRGKIHHFVRDKLVNIQSNTLEGNKMKLKLNKKMKKINPNSKNKYIHFILWKSNIDTMGAIFRLSKITGINQKLFSTAGLKDKRGVTTQMVSVYNVQKKQIQRFYQQANKNREIWIEGFKQSMQNDIGVGNLYGNQFSLILRLINPDDADKIHERVQSLKQIGMINYFGMQRFGSCGVKTHMIGLKILKREWKELVEELLLQETKDQAINQLKQQCYFNMQYAKAEYQLPNKYKIQKNLFKGFKMYGKNFQNVFESLPRSIRTLYPHSLQSYIWNRMVSRRIQEHGLQVIEGDIVGQKLQGFDLLKAQVDDEKQLKTVKEDEDVNKKQQEEEKQVVDEQEEQDKFNVQLVTVETKSNYKITDIVFPLFGQQITLPKDSLAHKYLINELNLLGVQESDFTRSSKQLCFKGMFRKMIIKPTNVSHRIIQHQSAKQQIQNPFYTCENEPVLNVEKGSKKAAQVILQLPKSSYATIALRQLLHVPSSFEAQMVLNKMYQAEEPKQSQNVVIEKQVQVLEE